MNNSKRKQRPSWLARYEKWAMKHYPLNDNHARYAPTRWS